MTMRSNLDHVDSQPDAVILSDFNNDYDAILDYFLPCEILPRSLHLSGTALSRSRHNRLNDLQKQYDQDPTEFFILLCRLFNDYHARCHSELATYPALAHSIKTAYRETLATLLNFIIRLSGGIQTLGEKNVSDKVIFIFQLKNLLHDIKLQQILLNTDLDLNQLRGGVVAFCSYRQLTRGVLLELLHTTAIQPIIYTLNHLTRIIPAAFIDDVVLRQMLLTINDRAFKKVSTPNPDDRALLAAYPHLDSYFKSELIPRIKKGELGKTFLHEAFLDPNQPAILRVYVRELVNEGYDPSVEISPGGGDLLSLLHGKLPNFEFHAFIPTLLQKGCKPLRGPNVIFLGHFLGIWTIRLKEDGKPPFDVAVIQDLIRHGVKYTGLIKRPRITDTLIIERCIALLICLNASSLFTDEDIEHFSQYKQEILDQVSTYPLPMAIACLSTIEGIEKVDKDSSLFARIMFTPTGKFSVGGFKFFATDPTPDSHMVKACLVRLKELRARQQELDTEKAHPIIRDYEENKAMRYALDALVKAYDDYKKIDGCYDVARQVEIRDKFNTAVDSLRKFIDKRFSSSYVPADWFPIYVVWACLNPPYLRKLDPEKEDWGVIRVLAKRKEEVLKLILTFPIAFAIEALSTIKQRDSVLAQIMYTARGKFTIGDTAFFATEPDEDSNMVKKCLQALDRLLAIPSAGAQIPGVENSGIEKTKDFGEDEKPTDAFDHQSRL